jgi:hypothetical protein
MGCICKKPINENNQELKHYFNSQNEEIKKENKELKYFSTSNNEINDVLQNTNINSNNLDVNSNDILKSGQNNNNFQNNFLVDFQNKLKEIIKSSIIEKTAPSEKIIENYSKQIIEFINLVRAYPIEFADYLKYCKKYIKIEKEKKINKENNEEIITEKIIYKKRIKVALNKGEEAFNDAINVLLNTEPMEPLIEKEELKIKLPENDNEVKDPLFLKNNVEKKTQ